MAAQLKLRLPGCQSAVERRRSPRANPPRGRCVVLASVTPAVGAKVEKWLQTPIDIAAFGPRATFGALVSLPERLQLLSTDVERLNELLRDPRPLEEKQQVVLQEVEDVLVGFLEKGATIETEVLSNIKSALPPDVAQQLDTFIPAPPVTTPSYSYTEEPLMVYSAESVLDSQLVAEMEEIKQAVGAVKVALDSLRINTDGSKTSMLRLNLREAKDLLARRLQEASPGLNRSTDASVTAATREANVLLDEVNAQFFN